MADQHHRLPVVAPQRQEVAALQDKVPSLGGEGALELDVDPLAAEAEGLSVRGMPGGVGGAMGVWLNGKIFDLTASYSLSFIINSIKFDFIPIDAAADCHNLSLSRYKDAPTISTITSSSIS